MKERRTDIGGTGQGRKRPCTVAGEKDGLLRVRFSAIVATYLSTRMITVFMVSHLMTAFMHVETNMHPAPRMMNIVVSRAMFGIHAYIHL